MPLASPAPRPLLTRPSLDTINRFLFLIFIFPRTIAITFFAPIRVFHSPVGKLNSFNRININADDNNITTKRCRLHTINQTNHRCGAEAARGAHNSEVTRSKRVSGLLQFVCFREVHSQSMLATINKHTHTHSSPGWRRGSARGS